MSDRNEYSDELINAYIDGELDNEERARLLFAEQEDERLANRINEARMLKEKVQLAYTGLTGSYTGKQSFSCSAFVNRHKMLVAGTAAVFIVLAVVFLMPPGKNNDLMLAKQLIKTTKPIEAEALSTAIGNQSQVLVHLSRYDSTSFDSTIKNLETIMLHNNGGRALHIEIVANGQGLKALDEKTSVHADQLQALNDRFNNLEIVACAKSLAQLASEGDPVQLVKSIITIPAAGKQVAKRTSQGWIYIKI